jgi:hypothetical protein
MAARRPVAPSPAASLAYSGSTDGGSFISPGYESPDTYDTQIDAVATKVLDSFLQSASPVDLASGRPSIPREIDRALLLDLCDALVIDDLPDPLRFRLRDRFWVKYDELSSRTSVAGKAGARL